jgi:hypothetical protein
LIEVLQDVTLRLDSSVSIDSARNRFAVTRFFKLFSVRLLTYLLLFPVRDPHDIVGAPFRLGEVPIESNPLIYRIGCIPSRENREPAVDNLV